MTKRRIFTFFLLISAAIFVFSGCGGDSSQGGASGNPQTDGAQGNAGASGGNTIKVELSIDYPDEAGLEDIEKTMTVPEGATVIDVLNQYKEEYDLVVAIEKGAYTYVKNIGGVSEKDYGDACGWVFEVNDQMIMEDASVYELADGDEVDWDYVDWNEATT